jgi:transposase
VRELIRSTGAKLFFLPKYSPDLNPIEQAFAKLKHLLRKANARSVDRNPPNLQFERGLSPRGLPLKRKFRPRCDSRSAWVARSSAPSGDDNAWVPPAGPSRE